MDIYDCYIHETRNALNAMYGLVQTKRTFDEVFNDVFDEMFNNKSNQINKSNKSNVNNKLIYDTICYIKELDKQFIDFKQQQKISLNYTMIYIDELLFDIIKLYDKQADIQYRLASNKVMTDIVKLKQILHNLLSNAIKYGKRDGKASIKIQCQKKKNEPVVVSIEDSGYGMKEPNGKKCLGLEIVKQLVRTLNITMNIYSSSNGTKIELIF
jgi:signal transduction histidine kinase